MVAGVLSTTIVPVPASFLKGAISSVIIQPPSTPRGNGMIIGDLRLPPPSFEKCALPVDVPNRVNPTWIDLHVVVRRDVAGGGNARHDPVAFEMEGEVGERFDAAAAHVAGYLVIAANQIAADRNNDGAGALHFAMPVHVQRHASEHNIQRRIVAPCKWLVSV